MQKGKQLRALYARYRERRAEAADLQAQFQVEREDLLADYRALSQQIKLKNLAIAAFIPPAYQDFIMARCSWNEYEEQWVIAGVQAAGEQAMALQCSLMGVHQQRWTLSCWASCHSIGL